MLAVRLHNLCGDTLILDPVRAVVKVVSGMLAPFDSPTQGREVDQPRSSRAVSPNGISTIINIRGLVKKLHR